MPSVASWRTTSRSGTPSAMKGLEAGATACAVSVSSSANFSASWRRAPHSVTAEEELKILKLLIQRGLRDIEAVRLAAGFQELDISDPAAQRRKACFGVDHIDDLDRADAHGCLLFLQLNIGRAP